MRSKGGVSPVWIWEIQGNDVYTKNVCISGQLHTYTHSKCSYLPAVFTRPPADLQNLRESLSMPINPNLKIFLIANLPVCLKYRIGRFTKHYLGDMSFQLTLYRSYSFCFISSLLITNPNWFFLLFPLQSFEAQSF